MTKGLKIGIVAGSILLVGCVAFVVHKLFSHTSDSHLSVIPKNAAAVLKIDLKQLAVKADPAKLMKMPGFQKLSAGSLKDLVADPFSTGIDPIENVYGFVATEGSNSVAALVFNVDDAGKLQTFENKLHLGTAETTVESGIYFTPLSETECIAWNDDAGLIIATKEGEAKPIAIKYLNQSRSNSIAENGDYKTFAKKTFDIGIFFNNKELSKMSGTEKSLAPLGMNDGHGEILASFEKDKIVASYTNYSTGTNSILKKNGPDAKQFDAVAIDKPLLYVGMAADMSALFSVLKNDPNLSTDLAGLEMGFGMGEDDLKTLFTGDISMAFSDYKDISAYDPRIKVNNLKILKANPDLDSSELSLNTPMCYISIGETDDAKMNALLANSGLTKVDSFYAMPGFSYIVYSAAKNGHLLITNDYYAAQQLSHTGKLSAKFPEQVSKGDAFSFYADLNQHDLPASLTQTFQGMYGNEAWQFYMNALSPFQYVRLSGKENGSELEISVNSGGENSLSYLIGYYSTLMN